MNTHMAEPDCQIKNMYQIADGPQEQVPFSRFLRLLVRKIVGPRRVQTIKKYIYDLLNSPTRPAARNATPSTAPVAITGLKTGDSVRVRSKDEIKATLDHLGQLKGCSFLPEMTQYCSTTQRVLKPVERFVDERDLRARKTKGIVLLDGITCEGTATLGHCDRNCFYFWRQEWLEKIERPTGQFR